MLHLGGVLSITTPRGVWNVAPGWCFINNNTSWCMEYCTWAVFYQYQHLVVYGMWHLGSVLSITTPRSVWNAAPGRCFINTTLRGAWNVVPGRYLSITTPRGVWNVAPGWCFINNNTPWCMKCCTWVVFYQ